MTQATKRPGLATRAAARAVIAGRNVLSLADEMRATPSTQGAGVKASNNDNTNVSTFTNALFGVAIGTVQDPVVSAAISSDQFISAVTSDSLTVPGSESDPDSLRKAKTTLSLKLKYLGSKSSSAAASLTAMGESTSKLNSIEQDLLVKAALSDPSVWENWPNDSMNPKDAVVHLVLSLSTQSEKPEEFLGDVLTHLTSVSSFEPSRASVGSPLMAKSVAEELVDTANHAKEVAVSRFVPEVVSAAASGSSAVSRAISDHQDTSRDVDTAFSQLSFDKVPEVSQKMQKLDVAKIADSEATEGISTCASKLSSVSAVLGRGTDPSFRRTNAVLEKVSADYSDTAHVTDGAGTTRKVSVVSGFKEINALLEALKNGDASDVNGCLTKLENCALLNKKNRLRGRVFASLGLDQIEVEDTVATLRENISKKVNAQKAISEITDDLSSDHQSKRVLDAVNAELDARSKVSAAIASDSKVATAVSLFSSALGSGSAGSLFRPKDSDYSVDEKTGKVSIPNSPKNVYADSDELNLLSGFVRAYNDYAVAKSRKTYSDATKLVDATLGTFASTLGNSDSEKSLKLLIQEVVLAPADSPVYQTVRDRVIEHANVHVYQLAKVADSIEKDYSQKSVSEFVGSALTQRGKRHASVYSLSAPVASSTVSARALGNVASNWSAFKATPKPLKSPSRAAQTVTPKIGSRFGASFVADAYDWAKDYAKAALYWALNLITHPDVLIKRTKKQDPQTGETVVSFEFNGRGKKFASEPLLVAGDRYVLSRISWAALKFVMMATFWNSLAPAPETDEGRFNHTRTVLRETTPVTSYAFATWPMRVVSAPVWIANWVGSQVRRDITVFSAAATGTGANDYRLTSGINTTVYPWSDDLAMPFDSRKGVRTLFHFDYGTEAPVKPIVMVTTSVANPDYALSLPDSEAAAVFGLPTPGSRDQLAYARLAYLRRNPAVARSILELQTGERVSVSSAPMPTMLDRPADRSNSRENTSAQRTTQQETLPEGGHCVERANDVLCNLVTVTRTPIEDGYRLPRSATATLVDALKNGNAPTMPASDTLYAQGYLVAPYEVATAQRYALTPAQDLHQLISFLLIHQSRINEAVGGALSSEGTSSMTIPLNQRANFARALYASAVASAPDGTNVTETPLTTETLNLLIARLVPVPSVIEAKLVEVLSNSADDESQRGTRIDALYSQATNAAARVAFVTQVGNLENDADVAFAATKGFNRANIAPNNSAELARFDNGMQRIRVAVGAVATAHYSSTQMAVDTSVSSARNRLRNTYHVNGTSEIDFLVANSDAVAFLDQFRNVNSAFILSQDPTTMNAFVREIQTRSRSSSLGDVLGRMNPFETRGASLVEFCKSRGFYSQRPASETPASAETSPQVSAQVNTSGIPVALSFPLEQIGANKPHPTVRMYLRRTLTPQSIAQFDSSVRGYVDRAISEYLHSRNPNLTVTDEIRIRAWAQLGNEAYAATSGNAAQTQAAHLRDIGILSTRANGTNNWTLTFQNVPPSTAAFTPTQTQAFAAIFDQAALAR